MFLVKEEVTQEELKDVAIMMLREGSFIYQNVEISLFMFDKEQLVLDYVGAFIMGARDVVLEYVEKNVFKSHLIPFVYDQKTYHVSFEVTRK